MAKMSFISSLHQKVKNAIYMRPTPKFLKIIQLYQKWVKYVFHQYNANDIVSSQKGLKVAFYSAFLKSAEICLFYYSKSISF